jgi:integrase
MGDSASTARYCAATEPRRPPTTANLKYAHRLAAEIRERIRFGSFSLAEYFPADGDVGQPLTVGTQLDDWLA